MFVVLKNIQQFKDSYSAEKILSMTSYSVIVLIVMVALFALYRPISERQYNAIQQLAIQQYYPQSQKIAHAFMYRSERICMAEYLKLMHVYQYEAAQERELEPVRIEQEKTYSTE